MSSLLLANQIQLKCYQSREFALHMFDCSSTTLLCFLTMSCCVFNNSSACVSWCAGTSAICHTVIDKANKQTKKNTRLLSIGEYLWCKLFFEDMIIEFMIHLKFVESLLIENMWFLWGKQNYNFIYFIL